MAWKKPILPQQLSSGFIVSNLTRRQKRELGETLKGTFDELQTQYRAVPWNKLELRDLVRFKNINTFEKDAFEQVFSEAREVVDNDCANFAEKCSQVRDQILAVEKEEEDDGKGTKELLIEISEKADLLIQQLSKESVEEHFQELRDKTLEFLNKQVEMRLKQLKDGIAKIVKDIKGVADIEYDAASYAKQVNGALTYGYTGVQPFIKSYLTFLEKGLGHTDPETFKNEFAPLTKFSGDSSLFASKYYNEEHLGDMASVVSDSTEVDDVKKHCKAILEAIRALPRQYKE